jgi:hypothetical protein
MAGSLLRRLTDAAAGRDGARHELDQQTSGVQSPSRSDAREFGAGGVRVNAIAPE